MSSHLPQEKFFEDLVTELDLVPVGDSMLSTLKSRIYSAIVQLQAASGPLLSLSECHAAGHGLCVFEQLVRIAPVGEEVKSMNPCRVCHARLLAERFEDAPIYWPNCPYVGFQDS